MKKFVYILMMLLIPCGIIAQDGVTVEIRDGVFSETLKVKMENQLEKLLVMMNESQRDNKKSLNFRGIDITQEARQTILQLWKYQRMHVWVDVEDEDVYICEDGIRFGTDGYQIRNIPMHIYPVDGTTPKDEYTEVCVNFNGQGKIVDFNVTLAQQQYKEIVKNAIDVQDEYNRKMLIHWMEQLATAYNQRDMQFFRNVFSEDALIITGVRKFNRQKTDVRIKDQERFEYNIKTKEEYLAKLNEIFDVKKNPSINIVFGNDAEYRRHGGNPRYYMVDVTQYWNTTGYSDVGHLFVLWDFKDPDRPQILVRAWQHPDDEKRWSARDFNLPQ